MTQSGASQGLANLESLLEVHLLARGREGVVPTELGRAVLPDARAALLSVERIQQRGAAAAGLRSGQLRIGTVASAAAQLLPAVLARFRQAFPQIRLTLLEGTDQEVLQWVEAEVVDLGLTGENSPGTEGPAILEDEYLLLVPPDHPLAGKQRIQIQDLAGQPFLMSGSGCGPAIHRLFATARLAPEVVLTVRDARALAEMVALGLGVTLMPQGAIPESALGLRRIPMDPPVRRQLFALTRCHPALSPALERFLKYLLP
jgi:DNA-binding transcriptional LysR family regulator